ncbi:MAG: WXG100 family type VII secretion target [Bacilli bacterium]|jgi:WXG100 family type VII secretion target|nr:WXG100 family type VII secretion target [Bacilli bacterium]
MADVGLKVSPERMREISEKSGTMVEDLKTKSTDLKNKKIGLMQIWRGPSATEFDSGSDVHFQKLEEFENVLQDMVARIKAGSESFRTTEEENVTEARKLQETNYNFRPYGN